MKPYLTLSYLNQEYLWFFWHSFTKIIYIYTHIYYVEAWILEFLVKQLILTLLLDTVISNTAKTNRPSQEKTTWWLQNDSHSSIRLQ